MTPPAPGPEPPVRDDGASTPEIGLVELPGRVPYRRGLELQRRLARDRIDGRSDRDLLLLLEHEPVLTLGRDADRRHLVADRDELRRRGVELVEVERGGDVTCHGPGQLVGYPVLDLRRYRRDLHWYLRAVEEALIGALGRLGMPSFRVPGHTGVWVGEAGGVSDGDDGTVEEAVASGRVRKVASIGVHVSRWITWHGFALNVDERALEHFRLVVPCGIEGVTMTTLEREGISVSRERFADALGRGVATAFAARVRRVRPDAVLEAPAAPEATA